MNIWQYSLLHSAQLTFSFSSILPSSWNSWFSSHWFLISEYRGRKLWTCLFICSSISISFYFILFSQFVSCNSFFVVERYQDSVKTHLHNQILKHMPHNFTDLDKKQSGRVLFVFFTYVFIHVCVVFCFIIFCLFCFLLRLKIKI